MTADWFGSLSPAEQEQWRQIEQHSRESTAKLIAQSSVVVSCVPHGKPDIKYAIELGLSIMMDKPIIVVAPPGRELPAALQRVATRVVIADLDTAEGQDILRTALKEMDLL